MLAAILATWRSSRSAHLLLCVDARTRPLRNDILLRLGIIIRDEGKSHARESSTLYFSLASARSSQMLVPGYGSNSQNQSQQSAATCFSPHPPPRPHYSSTHTAQAPSPPAAAHTAAARHSPAARGSAGTARPSAAGAADSRRARC